MINRINLILTHKCNLNCKHCYMSLHNMKQESDEIILKNAKKLIKKLQKLGIDEIMFTGGEVFSFKYIRKLLEFSKSLNIKNIVFTNALSFDYSTLEYIDQVNVSLDGNEKNHNQLRGSDRSYSSVMKLLDELKKRDTWTCIQMSIHKDNINDLDDLPSLLMEHLNVRYVHLNGIISKGNALNSELVANNDINMAIINKLPELYQKTKYHIQFKTSLISKYDFKNNYINEIPRIPIWIDLIDNDFYLIKNNQKYNDFLERFDIISVEEMYKLLHNELKLKKLEGKDYINIEMELDSL